MVVLRRDADPPVRDRIVVEFLVRQIPSLLPLRTAAGYAKDRST